MGFTVEKSTTDFKRNFWLEIMPYDSDNLRNLFGINNKIYCKCL